MINPSTVTINAQCDELECLSTIIKQMTDEQWVPDVVVGLVRGGLTPSVILSHAFNCQLLAIQWSTRDFATKNIESLVTLLQTANRPLNVLIVDDIVDSGVSFQELQVELTQFNDSHDVKYAGLYVRSASHFTPNFKGRLVTTDQWLDFSWELLGREMRDSR